MDTEYLFIDAGYLRKVFHSTMGKLFGVQGSIDLLALKKWCHTGEESEISRVFYYDCIDEIQGPNENDSDFRARLANQTANIREIQRLGGFFVRLGTLSGRKPGHLRQKEIDALLAVDMLENAFRRNMQTAWLLAGDRDFTPIVESLVHSGVYVKVLYEPRSASTVLFEAADYAIPLNVDTLHSWASTSFRAAHHKPDVRAVPGHPDLTPRTIIASGQAGNKNIAIWSQHAGLFTAAVEREESTYLYDCAERSVLDAYIELRDGEISWNTANRLSSNNKNA